VSQVSTRGLAPTPAESEAAESSPETYSPAAWATAPKVPFLLTMPTYGGTLAAVRSLGIHDIPVTVAGDELLAPARWSRFATRCVECPRALDTNRMVDWLIRFGDREPRHVLYASSDDSAFLFAEHAAELESRFAMFQPPLETFVEILDKKRLIEACASVGLDTPPTWFPESEADVVRIGREAPFPLLLKARTQVRRMQQNKGIVVEHRDDLLRAYRKFVEKNEFLPGLEPYFGDVSQPMIQSYFASANQHVYSVTGFIDRDTDLTATRAAAKIFQRTRPVGLGLCFAAAPLEPALAAGVTRLCRKVGHFGVFEVEFLRDGDSSMVIDFNPRFFGQMGFDAARGMPLALFLYLAATGNAPALRWSIAQAARATRGAKIYTHRFVFELLLLASQGLELSMSSEERRRWRRWYDENRADAVDASADARDWAPGIVHAVAELAPGFRMVGKLLSRWRS
jgi:D-aspartate ligase